jgi:hypothetical protein
MKELTLTDVETKETRTGNIFYLALYAISALEAGHCITLDNDKYCLFYSDINKFKTAFDLKG